MKANELRIGNLVSYHEKISIVHGITDPDYGNGIHIHYERTCIGCEEELIDPIQLTEEWLYSLGFVDYKCKDDVEAYISDIFIYVNNCQIRLLECGENTFLLNEDRKGLLYVHQLQNLYFALTGNELTITQ